MTVLEASIEYNRPGIRWIVFDAVGTLIRPEPSVAMAYHSIAARYGSRCSVAEVSQRFRAAFCRSEEMNFGDSRGSAAPYLSSDTIELARWRWIVGEVVPDVDDRERCFAELWSHFADPASWICFEEVAENLGALSQRGFRLAIASNFDSRLHSVCEGHSMLNPIERRFVSSETGYRKPAPQFYASVIADLNCPADQILMIGDNPQHDFAGPRAAGMRALLLDRHANERTGDAIQSLNELICDSSTLFELNGRSPLDQAAQ